MVSLPRGGVGRSSRVPSAHDSFFFLISDLSRSISALAAPMARTWNSGRAECRARAPAARVACDARLCAALKTPARTHKSRGGWGGVGSPGG
eukprot:6176424-Pleurochrysis_carterae.AAC.3